VHAKLLFLSDLTKPVFPMMILITLGLTQYLLYLYILDFKTSYLKDK